MRRVPAFYLLPSMLIQTRRLFLVQIQSEQISNFQIEDYKAMDTSSPAVFVNAELLPTYTGKKVRTVVQVDRSDGGAAAGKSTDGGHLTIKGLPQVPLMNYIEVIGIAESNHLINAEIWTDFGSTFDTNNYNQLCQLANGEFKSLFL